MTLGELITALEAADPEQTVRHGFTNPHSYRGSYYDLAFEPAWDVTVGDMLADARSALGATFEGYKGGDFVMGEHADCWLASWGNLGETIGPLLLELMLVQPTSPEQPAPTDRPAASGLTTTERAILGYALDLAQDQIYARGDEFTDDDQAAVDTLRLMADEEQQ
jgi:hypothetical protein